MRGHLGVQCLEEVGLACHGGTYESYLTAVCRMSHGTVFNFEKRQSVIIKLEPSN